ncbi:MAG: tRNA modification GTPase MnmE [bacterium]|nr:MAG: tRNA modification GTPase MnmE [bacterium]
MNLDDTIAAIATPPGEGGLGVIRVSGRNAMKVAQTIFIPAGGKKTRGKPMESHRMYFGAVVRPLDKLRVTACHGEPVEPRQAHSSASSRQTAHHDGVVEPGAVLDEVCIVYMKAPRSYTRQDILEIYCHGSPALLRRLLKLTLDCGARMAEPGEFTKRAFLNGRIDLTQAEGVIDFIKSRSETAAKSALQLMQGGLSSRIETVKQNLVNLLAQLEASIDFPDEEVETAGDETITSRLEESIRAMERLVKSYGKGRYFNTSIGLAIVGKPNVGKSSLLNAILEEDRAIVTPHPGTTRDLIRVDTELDGLCVELIDTAGLNPTPDEVEAVGIERALRSARSADVVVGLFDGSRPWEEADQNVLDVILGAPRFVAAVNKSDLAQRINSPKQF